MTTWSRSGMTPAQRVQQRQAIRDDYLEGRVGPTTTKQRLHDAGYPAEAIDSIFGTWQRRKDRSYD